MRTFSIKTKAVRLALPLAASLLALAQTGQAQVASPGFTISTFAQGTADYFQPDSIALGDGSVFVGYGNGTAKDGSDGKSNRIVEYTNGGAMIKSFFVVGHNDGLRVDPRTGLLWAIQNEDGNANLTVINPTTSAQTIFSLPAPHGGGYDDVVFRNGQAFLSVSAPNDTTAAAIVAATISGGVVTLTPIVFDNSTATDVTTGNQVTLGLTDPDSLTVQPNGNLLLVGQDDQQQISVSNPGTPGQTVTSIPLSNKVDDTVFTTATAGEILATDLKNNKIYAIQSFNFSLNGAYSAARFEGLIGSLDLTTGNVTPIVTSLGDPRGLVFLQVPEPGVVALFATSGLMGMGLVFRRRTRKG